MNDRQGRTRIAIGVLAAAIGLALPIPALCAADTGTGATGQPDVQSKQDADEAELGTIHVIAITPQQGADLPENLIPYSVQSTTGGDFERTQTLRSPTT